MYNGFVVNPSTHHTFKLPDPSSFTNRNRHICYLFGFDESRNEHQVVNITIPYRHDPDMCKAAEVMIFSMSTYSWRKIDAELPEGCCWYCYGDRSVCVNSVVHVMFQEEPFDILAYDLRTNKFSVIKTPQGAVSDEGNAELYPRIMKINGCIGVVCHDRVVETNEMHIWMLQDYENRVWVRETITFPKPWIELDFPFPLDSVSVEFSSSVVLVDRVRLYVYTKTDGCFKELLFSLAHQPLCTDTMELREINCYVESMLPL